MEVLLHRRRAEPIEHSLRPTAHSLARRSAIALGRSAITGTAAAHDVSLILAFEEWLSWPSLSTALKGRAGSCLMDVHVSVRSASLRLGRLCAHIARSASGCERL